MNKCTPLSLRRRVPSPDSNKMHEAVSQVVRDVLAGSRDAGSPVRSVNNHEACLSG